MATTNGKAPVTVEEDVFKQLVIADVKRQLAAEARHALLEHPEHWRTALVGLIQDINCQMAQNRTELDVDWLEEGDDNDRLIDYKQWKSAAITFKTKVETRLSEAKQVLRDAHGARDQNGLELLAEIRDVLVEIRDDLTEISDKMGPSK